MSTGKLFKSERRGHSTLWEFPFGWLRGLFMNKVTGAGTIQPSARAIKIVMCLTFV